MLYVYGNQQKENIEVNVNKNTDENEMYKEREGEWTQVNRHIHTKHTGKQLLYSH